MNAEPVGAKTCPRCPTTATGREEVEARFGFRTLRAKRIPQSWCRKCRANGLPVGAQPFRGILADPPWEYARRVGAGVAADQYSTMPTDAIAALPVPAIVDDDAVLLLWCTNPLLPDGLRVMRAWGFTYKTKLPWVKNTVGTGSWLRGCTEDLLLGTRGHPPLPKVAPKGVLFAKNPGHSQKPRSQYPLAETLALAPRVELFARQRRDGWTAWGNQLSHTVETTLGVA